MLIGAHIDSHKLTVTQTESKATSAGFWWLVLCNCTLVITNSPVLEEEQSPKSVCDCDLGCRTQFKGGIN